MIVFDLDDTLYLRADPFAEAMGMLHGVTDPDKLSDMFSFFRKRSAVYFERFGAGEIPETELYVRRIKETMARYGNAISDAEAEQFQKTYQECLLHIRPAEGIEEALQTACDLGIPLGILTNGVSQRQRGKIRTLGLTKWIPEEHIAVSSELGMNKPDPEVFGAYRRRVREQTAAKQRAGVDRTGMPEDGVWWYAGDLYEHDIAPAMEAGWRTIWLARRKEDRTAVVPRQPDHKVGSAAELMQVFKRIGEQER